MPAPTSQGWFQLSHIHVVWGLQNASSFMSSEQQHHTCPLHLNQILDISSQVFFFWCVNHIRHHTFCRVLQHVINPSNFGIFKSFWYSKSSSFFSGVLSLQYKWLQAKKKVKGKNRLYGSLKPVDEPAWNVSCFSSIIFWTLMSCPFWIASDLQLTWWKGVGGQKKMTLTFYIDNECLEYFCNFFFRIRMSPFLNQLHLVIVLITIVEAFKMPCYLVDCANHPLPTTTFLFFSFSYFH